ncbi:MAG: alpha/beta fold hydrolase [SAR202 cluster bacterium]|nr:alpha/beta fold hydrolase [SAR202 cluster bacterium]
MYAKVNGTRLYYTSLGKGRPVIFLHGGLGFDHTYFRPWVEPLAKRFRVIFYDHRGNGRSEGRDSLQDVDHSTWHDDLDALRAYLGFDKFVLVGHSYGGALGQGYALRYQKHLSGLALVTTYCAWDYMDEIVANARARGTPEQAKAVKDMLIKHVPSDEAFAQLGGVILPLYFKRFDPKVAERIGATTKLSYQAFNRGFIDCHKTFDLTARLPEIKVSTLVIAGRDDWIMPVPRVERIHRGIPNSKLVMFEESGHFPFIEERKKFLKVLGDWMEALPA